MGANVILGIDHIGLATDDPDGIAPFLALLGLTPGDSGPSPAYGVSCDFWDAPGGGTAVEVVSPAAPDSAVGKYLATRGPGLYHLALKVDDVGAEVNRLRAAGFVAIDGEPRAGGRDGMTVAFLYLRKPAGLLVELVHYANDWK
jgi:methylmalonyl-CoA/ethylmalonyl-CoA epimerase